MNLTHIMLALMYWIAPQTGYQVAVTPPAVVFLTPYEVAQTCIDEGTLVPYLAEACYKSHRHTIYLRDNFDIYNPYRVGVLVHELTHVMQLSNGRDYNLQTMRSLESEAELMERRYIGSPAVHTALMRAIGSGAVVADGAGGRITASQRPCRTPASRCGEISPVKPRVPAKGGRLSSPGLRNRYGVHVESYRSREGAEQAAAVLRRKYLGLSGTKDWNVTLVDLNAKGVYYRVFAGPFATREEAAGVSRLLGKKEKYVSVIELR